MLAPAAAQSLGAASADPWVGRPLDMSVPARFASAHAGDECVQADVFYGDQRVAGSQVRASISGAPGDRRVRIVADAPIDEPVVTVALRAGCRGAVTRTYTLLPAMPSGPTLAAAAARSAGAAGAVPSSVRLAATSDTALRATRVRAPAAQAPVRARAPAAEGPSRARAAPLERAREARENGGMPRLRLDAWEPEPASPATLLRVSAHLSQPSADAAARATAALLWQAINADPSELLRTGATLQRLEGELLVLRTTADQTRAEMAALRQALEAPPEGIQLSGQAAQVLVLLLLAGAAGAGFFWWRTARQQHVGGWRGGSLDSTLDSSLDSVAPRQEPRQVAPVQRTADAAASPHPARPASAWTVAGGVVMPQPPAQPARAELQPLEFDMPGVAGAAPAAAVAAAPQGGQLRVETLAATFQEVEFLTSLGLWGDATDVLKTYIADSGSPAPMAFFELMRLYAHAEDAAGAAAVGRRYAQVFGVEPPPLAQVDVPQGLQRHAELAARITRHWGGSQAAGMIEELLFAAPAPDKALSLEAGRDLLCLYQVAAELQREQAVAAGTQADAHGLAPWAHAEDTGDALAATQAAADYDYGLDLDLGAPAAPAPPPQDPGPELRLEEPGDDPLLAEFEAAIRGESAQDAAPATAPRQGGDPDPFSDAVAHESRRPLPR